MSCTFMPLEIDMHQHDTWRKMNQEFAECTNIQTFVSEIHKRIKSTIESVSPFEVTLKTYNRNTRFGIERVREIEAEYSIYHSKRAILEEEAIYFIYYRDENGVLDRFPFSMDERDLTKPVAKWLLKKYVDVVQLDPNTYSYKYSRTKFTLVFENELLERVKSKTYPEDNPEFATTMDFDLPELDKVKLDVSLTFQEQYDFWVTNH